MIKSTTIHSLAVAENNLDNKETLELIDELLTAFHNAGLRYCHWKSNAHIAASMRGDTDLDILFDPSEKETLSLLLQSLGFRHFESMAQKQYKGIEDFIGFDLPSGKIVHLHAHFQLTLGEAFLKSYQLDFGDAVLDSRVYVEPYGIYCSAPVFEYVLLWVRQALKMRNRDVIALYFNRPADFTGNLLFEYEWLKGKCASEEIKNTVQLLFQNHQDIYPLMMGPFNRKQVLRLSLLLRKELKKYRTYWGPQALFIRWYRETSFFAFAKLHKWWGLPVIKQRVNSRGGLSVAFIGADGSGKSTVIRNLQQTFGKKIDVHTIYFGKGSSGRKSRLRVSLLYVRNLFANKSHHPVTKTGNGKVASISKSFSKIAFDCLQAVLIAHEKKQHVKQMKVLTKKGALVIGDRFPQNQLMGINDGPALHKYEASKNIMLRYFSKLEAEKYAYAEANPPQIIFKLITDWQTAESRKPKETPTTVLKAKIEGIQKIRFAANCKVINIDATRPLPEVLYTIKKEIWNAVL